MRNLLVNPRGENREIPWRLVIIIAGVFSILLTGSLLVYASSSQANMTKNSMHPSSLTSAASTIDTPTAAATSDMASGGGVATATITATSTANTSSNHTNTTITTSTDASPNTSSSNTSSHSSNNQSTSTTSSTEDSKTLTETYAIKAVPNPNASNYQVQSRWITATTDAKSVTVNATGKAMTSGTAASGMFEVKNCGTVPLQWPVGHEVDGAHSTPSVRYLLAIILDRPVNLPAATGVVPFNCPGVIVPGHGQTGKFASWYNLPAQAFLAHTIAEELPLAWSVANINALTGGSDPQPYTYVQQNDIDGAAQPLVAKVPDKNTVLQGQVKSNEHIALNGASCQSNVSSDHAANDKATNVTVTVSFTCKELAYDYDGALDAAIHQLRDQAGSSLGNNYALDGTIDVAFQNAWVSDPANGVVVININVKGTWKHK